MPKLPMTSWKQVKVVALMLASNDPRCMFVGEGVGTTLRLTVVVVGVLNCLYWSCWPQ
jgi:hypothetical protein